MSSRGSVQVPLPAAPLRTPGGAAGTARPVVDTGPAGARARPSGWLRVLRRPRRHQGLRRRQLPPGSRAAAAPEETLDQLAQQRTLEQAGNDPHELLPVVDCGAGAPCPPTEAQLPRRAGDRPRTAGRSSPRRRWSAERPVPRCYGLGKASGCRTRGTSSAPARTPARRRVCRPGTARTSRTAQRCAAPAALRVVTPVVLDAPGQPRPPLLHGRGQVVRRPPVAGQPRLSQQRLAPWAAASTRRPANNTTPRTSRTPELAPVVHVSTPFRRLLHPQERTTITGGPSTLRGPAHRGRSRGAVPTPGTLHTAGRSR